MIFVILALLVAVGVYLKFFKKKKASPVAVPVAQSNPANAAPPVVAPTSAPVAANPKPPVPGSDEDPNHMGIDDQHPDKSIRQMLVIMGEDYKKIDAFLAALTPADVRGPESLLKNVQETRDLMGVGGVKAKQANDFSYKLGDDRNTIRFKQRNLNLPKSSDADIQAAALSGDYSKIPGA